MDRVGASLGEYLENFDPDIFINDSPETGMHLSQGLKMQNADDTKDCSFGDDPLFMQSESMSENAVCPQIVASTNEMGGLYSFRIKLGSQAKMVANPDWVFKNEKLYIKPSTVCPVAILTAPSVPSSCDIRVTPVFKDQAYIREVVRCCPNHTVLDPNNSVFTSVAHFIRCENPKVSYEECSVTGRFYLTLPFAPTQQDPTTNDVSTHELFSFICNNSCGGLNRRSIHVIIELIYGQCIIGRRLFEVRVCACPGRDSNLDEGQQFRRKRRHTAALEQPQQHVHSQDPLPLPSQPTTEANVDEQPSGRKKKTGEHFYLKVHGRQNYVIMERIAKALELFTSMERRFFSKNFSFQAVEQMSKNKPDEDYMEPDSTLYRHVSRANTSLSDHSSVPSPSSAALFDDTACSHGNHACSSSSQGVARVTYSTRQMRRANTFN